MNDVVLKRMGDLMKLRENVEGLGQRQAWKPLTDWLENDAQLILLMDLPGVDPQTLALQDDGVELHLQGSREDLHIAGEIIHQERPLPHFECRMLFPVEVVSGSAEARLRNGVLVLSFEKKHKVINAGT